jgi:hypothetical protein
LAGGRLCSQSGGLFALGDRVAVVAERVVGPSELEVHPGEKVKIA